MYPKYRDSLKIARTYRDELYIMQALARKSGNTDLVTSLTSKISAIDQIICRFEKQPAVEKMYKKRFRRYGSQ